jgi:PAS domain S-box-containing protein
LNPSTLFNADGSNNFHVLWEDGERVFCRGERDANGDPPSVLAVLPALEHPAPATLDRLAHEYGLKDDLDRAWAVRPLQFVREGGRTMLVLEDPGGQPLDRHLGHPMELGQFFRLAISLSVALCELHERGIIHKDIKPTNVLFNSATEQVWLTGFGIASRLPRERQAPGPPEFIAGTLAYMAPEQTGRMNRSIDARSDLYALGVTLYQMLTGNLPFTAVDPLEWIHCHIARKPIPPSERLETVPAPVSQIVMKLLAKTAEERYQTASGLERDLRRCLTEFERQARIDPFVLGQHDMSDRLVIPEKLYGREHEVGTLLAVFDRVIKNTTPELVLVSGYSGIGKSSVVNELHKVLVPPRGLFSSGKFDQYKRDIPYSTLAQAFQGLIRPLLVKSDAELAGWRDALQEALETNGQLMIDLVPELKLIVGDQRPVPELAPQDAQRRFQRLFRRFLSVFARPEHPLALFLDDLQWLDAATLDLLEVLLTQSDVRHLMLIGAYRDNEVSAAHPLMRKLEAIRQAGARVQEIWLAPLGCEHLRELTTDALHFAPERAAPLADLVHEKTGGNPFFVIQFLHTLADEGLLTFDVDAARWSWDLKRLHAKGYTDNIVDLMVGKLARRPENTQRALQQLACLGVIADTATLAIVLGTSQDQVHVALWDALCQELVERPGDSYRFIHDRVQEAAYSMIPEASRAGAHLRIGRLLTERTPPEQHEAAIFEIVSQFNRGAALIGSREEREQVAHLNLVAGKRAKASTAYASALSYFIAGSALLAEDRWERQHDLAFALELNRAECELLMGQHAAAEERLSLLSDHADGLVGNAAVTSLKVELYTTLVRAESAIAVCIEYLRLSGVEWSAHPTDQDVRQEYERLWRQIGSREIEELVRLPPMKDPAARATMDVLTKIMPAATFTDENLGVLVATHMANISLQYGNTDASCCGYVWVAMMAGPIFGDYPSTIRFGQLGIDLVEKRGLDGFAARVYLVFGIFVVPWIQHIRSGQVYLRLTFEAGTKSGDLTYSAYSFCNMVTNLLVCAAPLHEVEREALSGIDFSRTAQYGLVVDLITPQLGLIRSLRGLTRHFGSFNDAEFDEARFEQHLKDPNLNIAACWYWIRKMQVRFLAHDYVDALEAATHAQEFLWTSRPFFEHAEYQFYAALVRAASCDLGQDEQNAVHMGPLAAHYRQLETWAKVCPHNFEDRASLVGAEIARIEDREIDAMHLYEKAVRSARANGFVHNEALACELAARFYAARGFEINSHAHLRNARQCYESWGAYGKVRQLDQLYPHLRDGKPALIANGTIGASLDHLDLATIIKVSQAVSGEIVPEKLIDTLMNTAIEQAGAERGLLILARGATPRIAAEATTSDRAVIVHLCDEAATETVLPVSVLRYVLNSRESVILDDAAAQHPFSADPYINDRQARSVLCLPLMNQANLVGALYLENNLTPNVFAPARIPALKLVASQAAISLENSRLYRDLQEREAKIRRLVDANIIGVLIIDLEGWILEANDAFLCMVGYDRDDIVSGRMRWTDLTPPRWRDLDAQRAEQVKLIGTVQAFEKEYFRKDGSRVPVLVGARFEESGNQGVAFVLDLSERKQAEAEAREIERRYGEVQMELVHANRVATMGHLTASIAHEVNQPITAMIGNAEAMLRWLAHRPPNLEESRQLLARIIKDGYRASNVVGRIREHIKKAPPQMERIEINAAIGEVIELTRGEAMKNLISVRTQLSEDLLFVEADRTQLQQVMLNLIINAIHALSESGQEPRELLIGTSMDGSNRMLVSVRDSGQGISPEHVGRLFDPFYSTKPDGMGMGLSICRSIIEGHGGRIWVTENAPRGTAFHFTIPIDLQ